MAALYIHIPFCERKCAYCDFVSYENRAGDMRAYIAAVCREIHMVRLKYGALRFGSIFIGGGTPSLLPPFLIDEIMSVVRRYFVVTSLTEITIETNPGTLDSTKLIAYRKCGINRLSIGAQAAQKMLLELIGRIHDWDDVVQSVYMARAAGFDNINLDLMYGLPGQTARDWEETLKRAVGLFTEHLSCYSLTLEEETPLYKRINAPYKDSEEKAKMKLPSEDEERQMYSEAIRTLSEIGFNHYEISNWAKPKQACKHNLTYWHNDNYVGVGCAAHSCMDSYRYENTSNVSEYIRLIEQDEQPVINSHVVSRENSMFETVMLELRLLRGLDLLTFKRRYGESFDSVFGEQSIELEAKGLLERKGQFIRLTRRGLDLQNTVLVALMQ